MFVYISLLRGLNVGGHRKIKMEELKDVYRALGCDNVTSYIQSGNVVFTSTEADATALEKKVEQVLAEEFQFVVTVWVIPLERWVGMISNSPFASDEDKNLQFCHVTFLSETPQQQKVQDLEGVDVGSDLWHLNGKQIYLYCPGGYGRTKLSNSALERKLGVAATTRNWRTVTTLTELAKALAV